MCNCGNKNAPKTYVYTSAKGEKKTYKTEVEARAAQIRTGGSYRVV